MIACLTGLAVSADKSSQSKLGRRVAAALSKLDHCQVCGDEPGNPALTIWDRAAARRCFYPRESSYDVRLYFFFFTTAPMNRVTTGNQTISAELLNQFGFFGQR